MNTKITAAELQQINTRDPITAAKIKAMLGIEQALYDCLGAYPLENALPYVYGVTAAQLTNNPISANGQQAVSIKVTADAAFVGVSIRGASTGDFLTNMRIDSSDRLLQNNDVHSTALVGTGERPAPLHKPLMLQPNTTLSLIFTDLSGSANDVFFYIHGFKVYQRRTSGA